MVGDKGPGEALGFRLFEYGGETGEEVLAVLVVLEDLPSFNSPGHDVLE